MSWCFFGVALYQQTISQAYSWISLKFPKLVINLVFHCFGEVALLTYSFKVCFQRPTFTHLFDTLTFLSVISITVFHKILLSSPSIASNFILTS